MALDETILRLIHSASEQSTKHLSAIIDQMSPSEIAQLVTATDNDGRGYLHWCAAYRSTKEVADIFIEHGANLAKKASDGQLPGHYAVRYESEELCGHYSWKSKSSLDELDNNGDSQLHLASRVGKPEYSRILLINGANPNIQNPNTLDAPLHISVDKGDKISTILLLEFGADIYLLNKLRMSPVGIATNKDNSGILQILNSPEAFGIKRPTLLEVKPGDAVHLIYGNGSTEIINTDLTSLKVVHRSDSGRFPAKVRRKTG